MTVIQLLGEPAFIKAEVSAAQKSRYNKGGKSPTHKTRLLPTIYKLLIAYDHLQVMRTLIEKCKENEMMIVSKSN